MKTPLKFSALLAGAAILTSSALSAATTDPVGYVTISGATGGYVVTTPLLKSTVFEGPVNATGTTVLSFDSTVPTLTGANYVQVMSGTLQGTVVDITSSDGSSVTLGSSLAVASGDVVAIRPHFLIEDLGTNFTDGTTVTLYDSDGSSKTGQYQDNFLGTGWIGDSTEPIYPGEGFVIISTGNFEIVNTGAVSVDPVLFSGSSGVVNVVGALNPNTVDATTLFGGLPSSSTISVYQKGSSLTSPTVYTRKPEFLGGDWEPALTGIEFGSDVAVVVIPSGDYAIPIPATAVN